MNYEKFGYFETDSTKIHLENIFKQSSSYFWILTLLTLLKPKISLKGLITIKFPISLILIWNL